MSIVLNEDDISWQSILYDLVRKEGMDPFDIDVTLIAKRYLERIRELKDHDFRMSGKVLLAAAIMLKIKSTTLIGQGLQELDRLLTQPEFDEDAFFEEIEAGPRRLEDPGSIPPLRPRTPQPRKRKVSIHDLVGALQKALEVKRRRVLRQTPTVNMKAPEDKIDIGVLVKNLFGKIIGLFRRKSDITFSGLVSGKTKEDKVTTLLPLLYLSNTQRIELIQEVPFGEITIKLLDESPLPEGFGAEPEVQELPVA